MIINILLGALIGALLALAWVFIPILYDYLKNGGMG